MPFFYWISGVVLLWLLLPASLMDILLAPKWHAPHWQCDSPGVLFFRARAMVGPWMLTSIGIVTAISIPATWNRRGGADIFDLRLGSFPWNWLVTVPVVGLCLYLAYEVVEFFWMAMVPQSITADCGGRAEPITIVMRGPIAQITPVLEVAIGIWLLHLRALFLSRKRTEETVLKV